MVYNAQNGCRGALSLFGPHSFTPFPSGDDGATQPLFDEDSQLFDEDSQMSPGYLADVDDDENSLEVHSCCETPLNLDFFSHGRGGKGGGGGRGGENENDTVLLYHWDGDIQHCRTMHHLLLFNF